MSLALNPSALPQSALSRLILTNFRNYARLDLALESGPAVLWGANGAGKTNILEAVSFLSPGRGLRRARISDIDRREMRQENPPDIAANANIADSPGLPWAVVADFAGNGKTVRIGTGKDPMNPALDRRAVQIDGKAQKSQSALSEYISVTWLTPQLDRLFLEGSTERRRFLDRLVFGFDPAHAESLQLLDRAIKERARLLAEGRHDPHWLAVLESQIATQSVAVIAARLRLIEALNAELRAITEPFPAARLTLSGKIAEWLLERGETRTAEAVSDVLSETRRQDMESGGASLSAHKADLIAYNLTKQCIAAQCSTGEQKAILVSVILGHAAMLSALNGAPPIILLDEIMAHLDETRRARLGAEILRLRAQAFLTGTDADLFKSFDQKAQFFEVENGGIKGA